MLRPGTLSMCQLRRAERRAVAALGEPPRRRLPIRRPACSGSRFLSASFLLSPVSRPQNYRHEPRSACPLASSDVPRGAPGATLPENSPSANRPKPPALPGDRCARKHSATSKIIPVFTLVPFEFAGGVLFDLVVARQHIRVVAGEPSP